MLRIAAVGGLALAALLLAPAAAGQSGSENCNDRTDNKPFMVDVDADGLWLVQDVFFGNADHPAFVEVTRGCYKVIVDNMDQNASHTITISDHLRLTVGPDQFSYSDSSLVFFETLGSHTLRDEPSGDEFEIRVVEEKSASRSLSTSPSGDGGGKGVPGLGLAAIVALMCLLAASRRT